MTHQEHTEHCWFSSVGSACLFIWDCASEILYVEYWTADSSDMSKLKRFVASVFLILQNSVHYGFCTIDPLGQEQVGSAPMFTSLWYATPPGCCHAKMTNSHNLCCYATALPPSCTILHLPLVNAVLEQNRQKFLLGNHQKFLHHIEKGEQKRAESTAIATM